MTFRDSQNKGKMVEFLSSNTSSNHQRRQCWELWTRAMKNLLRLFQPSALLRWSMVSSFDITPLSLNFQPTWIWWSTWHFNKYDKHHGADSPVSPWLLYPHIYCDSCFWICDYSRNFEERFAEIHFWSKVFSTSRLTKWSWFVDWINQRSILTLSRGDFAGRNMFGEDLIILLLSCVKILNFWLKSLKDVELLQSRWLWVSLVSVRDPLSCHGSSYQSDVSPPVPLPHLL